MSEISKAYEPQSVEDKWYDFWLKQGCFTADPKSAKPAYSIVIPPPNVTGMLHMGHVLNNTIQDILARKARMDGKEVLWLPGTDHAGIATQVMVEKQLKKEEKKSRHDLGREEFLKRVWVWKEKHGDIIINQLKKLGCSCDWTRERFTMDPEYSRCVQKVFVELYKKGLIYRGKRMVNWCPVSQTALSDEEVEMKPQKGFMYHFKVEVADTGSVGFQPASSPEVTEPAAKMAALPGPDGKIWLTIATTRPETIPGDTAVAVNPKDPRYAHLIGKHIVRPLPAELPREQKLIPIIGDDHVDFEFGTGVLKVTPAHDKADFDIGTRHKLPLIEVINADGTMNDLAGADLRGLDRFKARKIAVEKLRESEVLVEEKPYENNVGFSQRADMPIEPRLSEQWFLKYPSVVASKACVANSRNVRVVNLQGDELSGATRSELRHSALKLARDKGWLGCAFPNQDTGWQIHVRRRSLSHAFSSRNAAAIQAVAALPELIQTAVLIRSEPHDPPAPDFKAVHHFMAALRIADEDFAVPITVKELINGQYLYDHKAKKITPGGKPLGPHPLAEKLGIQPAPGAGWKLADLLAAVNDQSVASMAFHPQRWAKVYDHWLANIQDWCISRQLWWGHRIPVWYDRVRWLALAKTIEVVSLTGNELPGTNARELRQSAWRLAKESGFLRQKFKNKDTGWEIYVNRKSLEHGFANQGLVNILLVPGLPDLLHESVLYATEPHVPPIPQVRAVHKFIGAMRLGGTLHRVKFTVKELLDGKKLYDHQAVMVKENEADGNSPGTHLREEKLVTRPASASPVKVAALFGSVNRDEKFLRCQIESPGDGWAQDPDVLDTWFSSWLWPFATMGWPEQTETLRKFYPTTDLVTGPDIIFFWVARMIMAGYEFMGDAKFALPDAMPFQNVYFTGIIRDKQGRKMSKTLGNSPDPLVLIAQYGADALRFGTMRSAPLGQDVLFDEKDVELGRNFCNKLWNACRFRQMQWSAGVSPASEGVPPEQSEVEGEINPALLTSDDQWILLRLDQAIREVSDALASYNFSTAVQSLYRFFWNEYCDWYVEASKAAFGNAERGARNAEQEKFAANKLAVVDFVLGNTLRMFHPFLPFITEELWHGMGFNKELPENQGGRTIMFAPWPKPLNDEEKSYFGLDDTADKVAAAKYELVSLGRNLRRELKLDPAKKLKFILKPAGELPAAEVEVLKLLLNAECVELVAKSWSPDKGTPSASNALGELFLPTTGLIDFAAERTRLTKDLEKINGEIGKVEQKLANPAFTQKVPPAVLEEHRKRLADWQAKQQQVQSSLDDLSGS